MKHHEDSRRHLFDMELPQNPIWTLKIVVVKTNNTVLGSHYHKRKTELFIMSYGTCKTKTRDVDSKNVMYKTLTQGDVLPVYPNTVHEFTLSKGAVMLCHTDQPYNPEDDFEAKVEI